MDYIPVENYRIIKRKNQREIVLIFIYDRRLELLAMEGAVTPVSGFSMILSSSSHPNLSIRTNRLLFYAATKLLIHRDYFYPYSAIGPTLRAVY